MTFGKNDNLRESLELQNYEKEILEMLNKINQSNE